jgi:16S rRNA (guanine1516-N2)-methyltransferase
VAVTLVDTAAGPALVDDQQPRWQPVVIELRRPRTLRPTDALPKVVGFPRVRTIIDATVGLGRDALSLWQLGCTITAIERNPLVSSLWQRLLATQPLPRFQFIHGDAASWLATMSFDHNTCILVDPMYPEGADRSAQPHKEMLMLRTVVGDDTDRSTLLAAARATGARVVLKGQVHADADHVSYGASTSFSVWHGKPA